MSAAAPLSAAAPRDRLVVGGIEATAGQLAEIEVFRALLETANDRTNLVGASTLGDFWRRHVVDSAQLLDLAPAARTWADLGSGAGLPGVILAILLKGRPGVMVHLIERRARRCAFLREVVNALNLPAEAIEARAESLRLTVDIVTARACAPLERLLAHARPYFERGARGLFLKGETVEAEMVSARRRWRFDATLHPSLSDSRGRVLSVTGLADV